MSTNSKPYTIGVLCVLYNENARDYQRQKESNLDFSKCLLCLSAGDSRSHSRSVKGHGIYIHFLPLYNSFLHFDLTDSKFCGSMVVSSLANRNGILQITFYIWNHCIVRGELTPIPSIGFFTPNSWYRLR